MTINGKRTNSRRSARTAARPAEARASGSTESNSPPPRATAARSRSRRGKQSANSRSLADARATESRFTPKRDVTFDDVADALPEDREKMLYKALPQYTRMPRADLEALHDYNSTFHPLQATSGHSGADGASVDVEYTMRCCGGRTTYYARVQKGDGTFMPVDPDSIVSMVATSGLIHDVAKPHGDPHDVRVSAENVNGTTCSAKPLKENLVLYSGMGPQEISGESAEWANDYLPTSTTGSLDLTTNVDTGALDFDCAHPNFDDGDSVTVTALTGSHVGAHPLIREIAGLVSDYPERYPEVRVNLLNPTTAHVSAKTYWGMRAGHKADKLEGEQVFDPRTLTAKLVSSGPSSNAVGSSSSLNRDPLSFAFTVSGRGIQVIPDEE